MESDGLERQLGELSGILKSLTPTLEKMEDRVNKAQTQAAAAEARYDAFRKEFDEWKTKVSYRLAGIFQKLDGLALGGLQGKNDLEALRNSVKVDVEKATRTYESRIKGVETAIAIQRKRDAGALSKLWDVLKMVIAAIIGAAVSLLFK